MKYVITFFLNLIFISFFSQTNLREDTIKNYCDQKINDPYISFEKINDNFSNWYKNNYQMSPTVTICYQISPNCH